jgi:hypothetical protein
MTDFKLFMKSINGEKILYGYNETVEMNEKLSELSDIRDDEIRKAIFLYYMNIFYDTYISLASKYYIQFNEATYGDVLKRFQYSKFVEHEVFIYLLLFFCLKIFFIFIAMIKK